MVAKKIKNRTGLSASTKNRGVAKEKARSSKEKSSLVENLNSYICICHWEEFQDLSRNKFPSSFMTAQAP